MPEAFIYFFKLYFNCLQFFKSLLNIPGWRATFLRPLGFSAVSCTHTGEEELFHSLPVLRALQLTALHSAGL